MGALPLRGRHLLEFDCANCGPVGHMSGLQVGELQICRDCILTNLVGPGISHETDFCPECWPSSCPACGYVKTSGPDHRAHVQAVHR